MLVNCLGTCSSFSIFCTVLGFICPCIVEEASDVEDMLCCSCIKQLLQICTGPSRLYHHLFNLIWMILWSCHRVEWSIIGTSWWTRSQLEGEETLPPIPHCYPPQISFWIQYITWLPFSSCTHSKVISPLHHFHCWGILLNGRCYVSCYFFPQIRWE